MAIEQTIRVHGYPFQVESDHRLSGEEERYLTGTLERFQPDQLKVLSEGRENEPPLRIAINKKEVERYHGINAFFDDYNNRVHLPHLSPRQFDSLRLQRYANVITHEFGHALDDFAENAVARPSNDFDYYANNTDSKFYSARRREISSRGYWHPYIFNEFLTWEGYGSSGLRGGEAFAGAVSYLVDPKRHERMAAYFWEEHHQLCIDVGDTYLTPKEYEAGDPYLQSVKLFLEDYPKTSATSLPESRKGVGLKMQWESAMREAQETDMRRLTIVADIRQIGWTDHTMAIEMTLELLATLQKADAPLMQVASAYLYLALAFADAGWRPDAAYLFQKGIESLKLIEDEGEVFFELRSVVENIAESDLPDTTKMGLLKQCVALAEQRVEDGKGGTDRLAKLANILKARNVSYEALSSKYVIVHGHPIRVKDPLKNSR